MQSKQCPQCGLHSHKTTIRCDCGYDFQSGQIIYQAACQNCRVEAPTKYVAFYQNIGAFIMRFTESIKDNLCKHCVNEYFWSYTWTTRVSKIGL